MKTNKIDDIRAEISEYFDLSLIGDVNEAIISPNGKYRIESKEFHLNSVCPKTNR